MILILLGIGYFLFNEDFELRSCEKISDSELKDSCISRLAYDRIDSSLCEEIGDSTFIKSRFSSYDVDPEIVKRKDDCYRSLGEFTNESSNCDKIKNTKLADVCYFVVANNLLDGDLCDKMSTELFMEFTGKRSYYRDNCYTQISQETLELGLCDRVVGTIFHTRESCREALLS